MSKTQKGITLIALIITIIVLLILAVVTISAVNEGSIFAHANNAATRYSEEAERENRLISNLLDKIQLENHKEDIETPGGGDDGKTTEINRDSIVGTHNFTIVKNNGQNIICELVINSNGRSTFIYGDNIFYDLAWSYNETNQTWTVYDDMVDVYMLDITYLNGNLQYEAYTSLL